ncbi:MAG: acetate--CoA ligase family protein, partial [Thermomicrobiales bacterium]
MAETEPNTGASIQIRTTTVFEGPNLWSHAPVVHAVVDASAAGPDGAARLFAIMSAHEPVASTGSSPGTGMWRDIGSVIEGISLQMQEQVGDEVGFSASRPAEEPGVFEIAVGYHQAQLAIATIGFTVRMLNAMLFATEPRFDFQREFQREVLRIVQRRPVRPAEDALFAAARRGGIPIRWVAPPAYLIELGTGVHMRRFRNMISSRSSHLGDSLSHNKVMTLNLLREVGVPVPQSIAVRTVEDALSAAERIGYPVVLKPNDSGQGKGLGMDLRTPEDVRMAFPDAIGPSRRGTVLVEEMLEGREHRILVIGGKIAAVAERMPAHVTGDGRHTIRELIAITNADPLRGPGHSNIMTAISTDAQTIDTLKRAGLTLDSIPAAGEHVLARLQSNMSQGGTSHDRTDVIHPDNARVAILAARVLEVEICGVDMIVPDISRSIWEVGGGIIELNAEPGPRLHARPTTGQPRDLGQAVIDSLYPAGSPVRIPVVAVSGGPIADTTSQLIARIVQESGQTTGLTTTSVNAIGNDVMARPDLPGQTHHQLVLRNPYVEFGVLQVAAGDLEAPGLEFDQCDVAVFAEPMAIGAKGLRSAEQVLIQMTGKDGAVVLDADSEQFEA